MIDDRTVQKSSTTAFGETRVEVKVQPDEFTRSKSRAIREELERNLQEDLSILKRFGIIKTGG